MAQSASRVLNSCYDTAAHLNLVFALPAWASSVSVETASASAAAVSAEKGAVPAAGKAEFDRKSQVVTWHIAKMQGGAEVIMRAKIVLAASILATQCRLDEFGVVKVNFELPMHLLSGISVSGPHIIQFKCFDGSGAAART